MCRHHETMRQVLGKFYEDTVDKDDSKEDIENALSKITGPTSYGLTDLLGSGKKARNETIQGLNDCSLITKQC